jgi:RimJ/RimL family protein N-acetyltransferase
VVQTLAVLIETERLLLRPLQPSDVFELVAMHADHDVARFVGPLDAAGARALIQADQRDWREYGHGFMAVIERATGLWAGRVALKYWPQFDEVEVGWALRRELWGLGFASEAGSACARWGFRELDLAYLTAMIRPGNMRSIAVARHLGMSPLRAGLFSHRAVVVYAVGRERWVDQLGDVANASLDRR